MPLKAIREAASDAKIAERFGSLFDRVGGSLFPGFFASTDQQNTHRRRSQRISSSHSVWKQGIPRRLGH
jgi:hypothetical protein